MKYSKEAPSLTFDIKEILALTGFQGNTGLCRNVRAVGRAGGKFLASTRLLCSTVAIVETAGAVAMKAGRCFVVGSGWLATVIQLTTGIAGPTSSFRHKQVLLDRLLHTGSVS